MTQNLALNKNGDPCREAALYMSEFFRGIAKNENNTLDFKKHFLEEHACCTAACHGGWGFTLPLPSPKSFFHYEGANNIAQVMGFPDYEYYEDWAYQNPDKWGSNYGYCMFLGYGWIAFGNYDVATYRRAANSVYCPEAKEVTLFTITDWYEAMAPRLQLSDNGWEAP